MRKGAEFDVKEVLTTLAQTGQAPELGPDNALPAEQDPASIQVRAQAAAAEQMLKDQEKLTPEERFAYAALVENGKTQQVVDMMNDTVRAAQHGREDAIRQEMYGSDLTEIDLLQKSVRELEGSFGSKN